MLLSFVTTLRAPSLRQPSRATAADGGRPTAVGSGRRQWPSAVAVGKMITKDGSNIVMCWFSWVAMFFCNKFAR